MMRDLHIKPVLNGFIVNVGCQTLVFDNPDDLLTNLGHYFRNPQETESKILKTAIHRKHTMPGLDPSHDPIFSGGGSQAGRGTGGMVGQPETQVTSSGEIVPGTLATGARSIASAADGI